ncbi:hypothetical protein ACE1AT_28415 [Pelatocladus sp. BLCC-F211]|uniref:hypothetical protein n=1 Tax=Pelatocladus sp. BLCC-F211 TaxID=3342752 RepID=UPI0035B6D3DD
MKKKKKRWLHRFSKRVKSISVIGITVFTLSFTVVNSVAAATLDTTETRTVSQIANYKVNNLSTQIQDFIDDVRSFVRGDFFGSITKYIQNAIGSQQVPDLDQVVSQIMTGSFPEDAATSTKFENNLANSYAIRQDLANQSERVGAISVAQTKTLSKTAQQKSKVRLEQSANSALESAQMADDSQNSDTSQQILQNISQQLKNNATIANFQFEEASQARQDRALALTLGAQTAQELNVANTRERQTMIATGNTTVAQGALLIMPGGAVLGQDSSN